MGGQPQEEWFGGRGRPAQQQSPWCLLVYNLMSSAPLQPERLIWNLHSVLLANDSGNARQEQRRIVACPLLNLLSASGSNCVLQYSSKLACSCTSGGELSLFAYSELSWMPHRKREAAGICISYPKLSVLPWQAFTVLNCQYSSNWSRGRLKIK